MAYIMLAYFIRLDSMTHFNNKMAPNNNTDYSCHLKEFEIVQPNIWGPYYNNS